MMAAQAEVGALAKERSRMNHAQNLILLIGIGVAVLMGLYPLQVEISASQPKDGQANIYVESAG